MFRNHLSLCMENNHVTIFYNILSFYLQNSGRYYVYLLRCGVFCSNSLLLFTRLQDTGTEVNIAIKPGSDYMSEWTRHHKIKPQLLKQIEGKGANTLHQVSPLQDKVNFGLKDERNVLFSSDCILTAITFSFFIIGCLTFLGCLHMDQCLYLYDFVTTFYLVFMPFMITTHQI